MKKKKNQCKHKSCQLYRAKDGELVMVCDAIKCRERVPTVRGMKFNDRVKIPALPDGL